MASDKSRDDSDTPAQVVGAAAVAGGTVGLVVAGPTVATIAAGAMAYSAAHDHEGAAGDAARATGEAVVSVAHKAKEYDDEHHVVEHAKKAAQESLEQAKQYEKEHLVMERTKQAVMLSYRAMVEFENKHQIVNKSLRGVESGAKYVAKKVTECTTRDTTK